MEKVFDILTKKYNLKSTHIRIIKSLLEKEYSARDLSKTTSIPIGSIYELLKELLEYKLIQEKRLSKKIYYIDDFEENILNFSDNEIDKYANAREDLLSNLIKKKNQVVAFDNYSKFKLECIKKDPSPKVVDGFIANYQFPIFFYPSDKNLYFEYKKKINNLLGYNFSKKDVLVNSINKKKYEALHEKNIRYRWIINEKEFNDLIKISKNISKDEYDRFRDRVNSAIKNKDIELYISKEVKDYQFIITDKTLQFQLRMKPLFVGMIISDSNTIEVYKKSFESLIANSNRIKEI